MNAYLPHALFALLLAAPALAGTNPDGAEPPVQDHAAQAEHAEHGAPDAHADHLLPDGHDTAPLPAIRWASDAPLREGMRRVRRATQSLAHGGHGHLDSGQVQAIAAELEAAVLDMFARCKLAPEPDAALHPLLARVLDSSKKLSAGEFDPAALADLEAVLTRYPALFEDADWSEDHSASA
ncbi:DnrO protein [Arenimonas alkanexedens]